MPRMDLTGQRFGRLTVIEEAEPGCSRDGTPYRRWRCRCDCGNEIVARQSALRNGSTKSCGCLRRELASAIQIDLTGQRFGRLTVLEEAEPVQSSGNLLRCWRCRCDCGNELIVRQSSLRNGNTKSCGCLQRDMAAGGIRTDLPGRRFGRLTVLDEADPVSISGTSYRRWRCRCDCGNEIVVRQSSLTGGQTRSCGCLMRDTKAAVRIDLTGQRFGRLVVLEEAESGCNPGGKAYRRWRCRCDCGNEIVVRRTQLTGGRTRSCGCLHRDAMTASRMDLTGQRFGRLTVLDEAEPVRGLSGNLLRCWRCRCDCGSEITVRQTSLTSGQTRSCGCLKLDTLRDLRERASAAKLARKGGKP